MIFHKNLDHKREIAAFLQQNNAILSMFILETISLYSQFEVNPSRVLLCLTEFLKSLSKSDYEYFLLRLL